jgi:hypothetical protein
VVDVASLEQFGDGIRASVQSVVQELRGEDDFVPVIIVNPKVGPGQIIALGGDLLSFENKEATVLRVIPQMLRPLEPQQFAIVIPGWQVKHKSDADAKIVLRPSQDPLRQEIVSIMVYDADSHFIDNAPVLRHGGLVALGDWDRLTADKTKISGLFATLWHNVF